MPSTTYVDTDMRARAIQARTDSAGTAVDDISAEEDRLIHAVLTEGLVTPAAGWNLAPISNMDLALGSGQAKTDVYCVAGDAAGQLPYLVRLEATSVTITVPAADPSQQRIDEVWLVVQDNNYDASSRGLPRIGYRTGDPGGSGPGADAAWTAAALLWRITVPAGATEVQAGNLADQRSDSTLLQRLLEASLNAAALTLTNMLTISASGDGAEALRIDIDRAWRFIQRSTGAATRLVLQALSGTKRFEIEDAAGNVGVSFGGAEYDYPVEVSGKVKIDGADGARIDHGTYPGDGASNRLIALSFDPRFVVVSWETSGVQVTAYSAAAQGEGPIGLHAKDLNSAQGRSTRQSRPELAIGGFRVGGNSTEQLNQSGITYTYTAIG